MKKKRGRKKRDAMKRGRKKGSGVLSGIPEHETWDEIRKRIIYNSAEWPLVGLRKLIGDGSKLPVNFLSAEYLSADTKELQQQEQALRAKIAPLWRPLVARFERAVLDGDADWFKRQSKALGRVESKAKVYPLFNAKVVHLLELAMWETHARQGDNHEDLTLTPAGKFTEAMARRIFEELDRLGLVHVTDDGRRYKVLDREFASIADILDAIHDLARRIKLGLKKQPRPKRKKH